MKQPENAQGMLEQLYEQDFTMRELGHHHLLALVKTSAAQMALSTSLEKLAVPRTTA